MIYLMVKMQFRVHKHSQIVDAVSAYNRKLTQFVIETEQVCFLEKEITLVLSKLSFVSLTCTTHEHNL
jgi:hypothetical protein